MAKTLDSNDSKTLDLFALKILHFLTGKVNLTFLLAGEGSVSKQFARANKHNAMGTIIIGENEINQDTIKLKLKWMDKGKEEHYTPEELVTILNSEFALIDTQTQ